MMDTVTGSGPHGFYGAVVVALLVGVWWSWSFGPFSRVTPRSVPPAGPDRLDALEILQARRPRRDH
jgi:hypothetical protein